MQDIRQTKSWAQYLSSSGWKVEKIDQTNSSTKINVYIKKIPLLPLSVAKIQRFPGQPNLSQLNQLKRKHHLVFTSLEPLSSSLDLPGFRLNKSPYLPSKTIIINLRKTKNQLYFDFSTNTKRILNQKTPVVIKETTLNQFYSSWQKAAKTWILSKPNTSKLLTAFAQNARLLISLPSNQPPKEALSGLLLLFSKNTANYYQTFTSPKGRRLNAHYHLVWQAILLTKKLGLKYFDFEGIYDPRFPLKPWQGFTQFKRKFGGKKIDLPGCYSKWF